MPTPIQLKAVQFLIIEENAIHSLQLNGNTWNSSWRATVNGHSHSFSVDLTIDQTGASPQAITTIVIDGRQRSLPTQTLQFDDTSGDYTSEFQAILPAGIGVVHIEIAAIPIDGTLLTIVPPAPPLEFTEMIDCKTANLLASFTFRPTIDTFCLLEFQLIKKNSTWVGNGTGDFDLGSDIACGQRPPLGMQSLKATLNLSCGQAGGKMNVSGLLVIITAKTFIKIPLVATGLTCPSNSNICDIEWPTLYLGPFLGSGSLVLHGIKT